MTATTYDRPAIFKAAHAAAKKCYDSPNFYVGRSYADCFKGQLKREWSQAKCVALTAQRAARSDAERIREARIVLDSKNHWTQEDYAKADVLATAEYEARDKELAEKRDAIDAAKGRFVSVTFTKKDGSERIMRVQPAALKNHVIGEAASEAARKAVETRAARHPHLMPVWDVDKAAIRSVNLATVSRIAVNGTVKEYLA